MKMWKLKLILWLKALSMRASGCLLVFPVTVSCAHLKKHSGRGRSWFGASKSILYRGAHMSSFQTTITKQMLCLGCYAVLYWQRRTLSAEIHCKQQAETTLNPLWTFLWLSKTIFYFRGGWEKKKEEICSFFPQYLSAANLWLYVREAI